VKCGQGQACSTWEFFSEPITTVDASAFDFLSPPLPKTRSSFDKPVKISMDDQLPSQKARNFSELLSPMVKGVKLVVVGDGAGGKTCLLVVYRSGEFPSEYVPTVYDNSSTRVTIGATEVDLQLWDTAGQEELETIRCLSYPSTDLFLICFSVSEGTSLANVRTQWLPELVRYVGNPKVMLVATKADLRGTDQEQVSKEDAQQLANEIKAVHYIETAAATNQGVQEVFEKAVEYVLNNADEGGCCSVQ
jgi:small GTP-binding protein